MFFVKRCTTYQHSGGASADGDGAPIVALTPVRRAGDPSPLVLEPLGVRAPAAAWSPNEEERRYLRLLHGRARISDLGQHPARDTDHLPPYRTVLYLGVLSCSPFQAIVLEVFDVAQSSRGEPGHDDRKFLEAIHYFTVHSITWRALPSEFGKWNSVWKRFWRLSRSGVFEAFFQLLAECSPTAHLIQFFDSTTARAHVSAAGQKRLPCLSSTVSTFDGPCQVGFRLARRHSLRALPWGLRPHDCIEDAEEASHVRDESNFFWSTPFDQALVVLADGVPPDCR